MQYASKWRSIVKEFGQTSHTWRDQWRPLPKSNKNWASTMTPQRLQIGHPFLTSIWRTWETAFRSLRFYKMSPKSKAISVVAKYTTTDWRQSLKMSYLLSAQDPICRTSHTITVSRTPKAKTRHRLVWVEEIDLSPGDRLLLQVYWDCEVILNNFYRCHYTSQVDLFSTWNSRYCDVW